MRGFPATILLGMMAVLAACGGGGGGGDTFGADVPGSDGHDARDVPDGDVVVQVRRDHTVAAFGTPAEFLAYAGPERAPAQVKFILRGFDRDAWGMHFEEPGFFEMHDAWSWYSLLNGIAIPDYDYAPVQGLSFDTVADVVAWAKKQAALPYDLGFTDADRLYSNHFYERSLGEPRFFGVGSVLHYDPDPARPLPGELWLFELEYLDAPSVAQVTRFFERLVQVLPPEAAGLRWLVRTDRQLEVAQALAGGPWAGRYVTYDQVLVPGDFKAYNPGIAAGMVRIVPKGQAVTTLLQPTDIVVLEEVPDDIPPVAAIITGVPQTPLAHIGLLAKARGTPNLYLAAATKDPRLETWGYYRSPVIVEVTAAGYRFRPMTQLEMTAYLELTTPRSVAVTQVDLDAAPETLDPLATPMESMHDLVPLIGGKSGGFLALHTRPGADLPDAAFSLTIKGYARFLPTLDPPVATVLDQAAFKQDVRVRYLVLEGQEAFLAAATGAQGAQAWLDKFLFDHAGNDPLGVVIRKGGLRQMVMDAPIDAGWLQRVTQALSDRFAFLAPSQGLRFRSSSTAEDVEGFNGAGLYESHTGYLHPEAQTSDKKKAKTVEDAIRRVWSSYWLAGAFEERRAAGIDHLSGNMGLLVHPNFDDDKEAANGVITLELVRRPDGDVRTLTVNAQKGALSVTNPPPGSAAAPEVDMVRRTGAGAMSVERVQPSTEVGTGEWLVTEAELTGLVDTLAPLADAWLDLRNARLQVPQRSSTLTLDLEFKRMAPGWPARADGVVNPERFVFKQARTLEDPNRAPAGILSRPVPRDLLARTVRADRVSCNLGPFGLSVFEFYTDPAKPWPFDFAEAPFTAYVEGKVYQAIPGFPWAAAQSFALMHTQATVTHPGMAAGGTWALDVAPADPATAGFRRLAIAAGGAWTLEGDGAPATGTAACNTTVLMTSPQAFLQALMEDQP